MQNIYKSALKKARTKVFDNEIRYIRVIEFCKYKIFKKINTLYRHIIENSKGKILRFTDKNLQRRAKNFNDYLKYDCFKIEKTTILGNKNTGIKTQTIVKVYNSYNTLMYSKIIKD